MVLRETRSSTYAPPHNVLPQLEGKRGKLDDFLERRTAATRSAVFRLAHSIELSSRVSSSENSGH